jgi:hypothetical protein
MICSKSDLEGLFYFIPPNEFDAIKKLAPEKALEQYQKIFSDLKCAGKSRSMNHYFLSSEGKPLRIFKKSKGTVELFMFVWYGSTTFSIRTK